MTYSAFPETPQIRVSGTAEMLERKLEAISAFESQRQIGALVARLREGGPVEHLREIEFHFYSPSDYDADFMEGG